VIASSDAAAMQRYRQHQILHNRVIFVVVFLLVVGAQATVGRPPLQKNNNMEAKKEEQRREDAQKESTLQPITKVNNKLDKELQEWEVESTESG
jgi:hypothetical protein